MGSNWEAGEQTSAILDILEDDPRIDMIAVELSLNMLFRRMETNPVFRSFLLDMPISHRRRTRKAFLAIVPPSYVPDAQVEFKRVILSEEIPSFPTFSRAARALRNRFEYQRFVAAEEEDP